MKIPTGLNSCNCAGNFIEKCGFIDDRDYQAAKREYFARYPGGESYFDMAARVYPLIEELEGRTALLVTHGGICRIIRSYFQDMGNEEFVQFAQGNCEVKIY